MPSRSLRELAGHLDLPERTVRRAAAEGLIHGRRESARRFLTTLSEENYLRQHWGLLSDLRDALRTEPNVRLAVLFGSAARGEALEHSDLDLVVSMENPTARRVAGVTARLEARLGRDVQLVRGEDAEMAPLLARDVLGDGRVLTDRDDQWAEVRKRLARTARHDSRSAIPDDIAAPDLSDL